MRAAIISFTEAGDKLGEQIAGCLKGFEVIRTGKNCNRRSESLADWTGARFGDSALIVFIGAVGIAVRACAPYIVSKRSDPAVIAADEKGRYVIPILSGHIGGANGYARMIAAHIGADAVITTATDINGCFAADEWAVKNGYAVDDISKIKYISSALLGGSTVGLVSEFKIKGSLPDGIVSGSGRECGLYIGDKPRAVFDHTLCLIPKRYIIGVGSRAGAEADALIALVTGLLDEYGIRADAAAAVASVDLKANEPSVGALAKQLGVTAEFYTADQLCSVRGDFTESEFVRQVTGAGNVCERAAVICGERLGRKTRLVVRKTAGKGVTAAIAEMDWSVEF